MKSITLATTALLAIALNSALHAQIVPFEAQGKDAKYNQPFLPDVGDGSNYAIGRATHMGKIEGTGVALPTGVGNNWSTVGKYTLKCRNGDCIYMSGGGTIELIPVNPDLGIFKAIWTGKFNVVGGTGRFANVGPGTAPIDVVAINEPFTFADPVWEYSWTLSGNINLGKSQ
jgi:hypothetical protein